MRASVVGAGFAGLAAAAALQRAGVDVIVLEARERVGGRVWSQELPNGAVIERGAEFIEHYHSALSGIAGGLGLRLAPTGMAYGDREPRGGLGVDRATLTRAYTALIAAIAARHPDADQSVAQFLEQVVMAPGAREAIVARIEISSTQPIANLAADSLMRGAYNLSLDESLRVAGGNQRIALGLADRLGAAVRLGAPVDAVEWSTAGVRLWAAGAPVEADVAVLTVPARLLGQVRFDPPLPVAKQRALADIDYGHAAKLFVPLSAPTAPSAVMSTPERFWVWTANDAAGDTQLVANCFAGSAPALDALGVAAGPDVWLTRLAEARPDVALLPAEAVLSTWDDDPWIGASYSTTAPGRPRAIDELTRADGPLHYAGEHTAGMWSSTMEGALRSGLRAASEIAGRSIEAA